MAQALDLIGERWAGLVIRELILGPKRFSDLTADLGGASASVLSDRLRELEAHGIVVRRRAAPPSRVQLYELTPWGRELAPILVALGSWALRSPGFDSDRGMSDDAAALTLSSYFVDGPSDWDGTYELRIGRGVFDARVVTGHLELERGAARGPAAVLTTDAVSFTRMLGPRPTRKVAAAEVTGDKSGLRRLLARVRLPRP